MKTRKPLVIIIYIAVLALAFSWILGLFSFGNELTDSQIEKLLRDGQVKSFVVEDGTISMKLHEAYEGKTEVSGDLADVDAFRSEMMPVIRDRVADGTLENYDFVPESEPSAFDLILPLLIVGLVLILIWAFFAGRANGANPMASFGKARAVLGVPDGKKVTFADVAGADEEKAELQEIVDFLRDPDKYTKIGARIPHGLLLVGPPGTGKTLLARAVAGEADVQFLSISGSDFVEMYVGVGASRVRDLLSMRSMQWDVSVAPVLAAAMTRKSRP